MEFLETLDRTFRAATPILLCFIALLLGLAPWSSPVVHALFQALPLMMLCYWVVYKPDIFPMAATFALGLFTDLLSGQFLGLVTLSYLIADYILRSQRSLLLHQSFLYGWLINSLVLAGTCLLQWLLASMAAHSFLDFASLLLRMAFSVLLFPLLSGLLQRLSSSRG